MKMYKQFFGTLAVTVSFLGLGGCEDKSPPVNGSTDAADSHDHAHPSEGPHHGQLIELGNDEYHAELVHDDDTHTVTIHLLDGQAKNSVASEEPELVMNLVVEGQPTQFTLVALPESNDPEGKSSKFQSQDEAFCKALDAHGVKGRLNVTVNGKPLVGSFKHGDHDHGHDHAHDNDAGHDHGHDNDHDHKAAPDSQK